MPVKIWEESNGVKTSLVVTEWEREWTSEEFRQDAEDLDRQLDEILDRAVARISESNRDVVPAEFVRAWAVGHELNESGVLNLPALEREEPQLLWRALARKCRLGARADGSTELRWAEIRPIRASEPRREGGKLDYFEMCRWLAAQPLNDAVETFGGSIRNAWQMFERPSLRPLALRLAFLQWLRSLPPTNRQSVQAREEFANAMKLLRKRWPDRGAGSAKRPIHYDGDSLFSEIDRVLADAARRTSTEIASGSA